MTKFRAELGLEVLRFMIGLALDFGLMECRD
jgi:hypothetical protein